MNLTFKKTETSAQSVIEFAKNNNDIDKIIVSDLSQLGNSVEEIYKTLSFMVANKINLHIERECITLFDNDGNISSNASIMISTIGTVIQMKRDEVSARLNEGRKRAIENGTCTLGRKKGCTKSHEKKAEEYQQVIKLLKFGYSIRKVAKLTDFSVSTVQRVKKEFSNEIIVK